jgi:hypothetical protein
VDDRSHARVPAWQGPPEAEPQQLERVDRTMLAKMRTLTAPALKETMDKSLTKDEIDALLARRDAIVKLFDEKIAQRGEAAVLFALASQ